VIKLADILNERDLTLEEAAHKSGLSLEQLKNILEGGEFSLRDLRLLAKKLHFSIEELLSAKSNEPEIEVLFRKNLDIKKEDEHVISWLARELANIISIVGDSKSNIKWINKVRDKFNINKEDIELLSQSFRKIYFDGDYEGPILSLPEIISNKLGAIVVIIPGLPIEGASILFEEKSYIFLAPRKFKARMFFTLAHELGHFLLDHHNGNDNFATFDSDKHINSWGDKLRKVELDANQFASSLLIPHNSLLLTIKNIRSHFGISGELGDIEINYIARFFGVSFEVAARRCELLGLLPKYGARTLYEHVCEEYKNPERRADGLGMPSRPNIEFPPSKILLSSAAMKVRKGEISTGRAVETLHLQLSDLFKANIALKG